MNNDIKIVEKKIGYSFDDIKIVMDEAHNAAKNDKLTFPTSNMTEEDFKKTENNNGRWFLAVDGDRVVGTIYGVKEKLKSWYYTGNIIVIKYVAILPEYSGRHLVSKLYNKIFDFAKSENISVCIMSMSEFNFHHQHVAEKNGFILIDYYAVNNLKNYTLKYAFWINDKCPHSYKKIRFMLFLRKIKAKIKRFILRKLGG